MKIEGDMVTFKSMSEFFYRERDGKKPNTERLMSLSAEYPDFIRAIIKQPITKIKIELSTMPEEYFIRELTDVCIIGELLGQNVVVFSWKHEEE